MYLTLYRKWRPLKFSDVTGQAHITDTLKAQLVSGRLSHSYLFTGTRGTGKTTCAKILARAVNCLHPIDGEPCNTCEACLGILNESILDIVEIDAASNNGVDNIRQIRDEVNYTPAYVKKRVYIIDEVHMLSTGAFNALLKTLEEPPEHVMFILATTEVQKLPATILSRCQRFDFKRISPQDIAKRVQFIANKEKIPLTADGADVIASLGDGSMRDALSVLERFAAENNEITAEYVRKTLGLAGFEYALAIAEGIADNNVKSAISAFEKCYADGCEINSLFDALSSLFKDLLMISVCQNDCGDLLNPNIDKAKLKELSSKLEQNKIINCLNSFRDTAAKLRTSLNQKIDAELCFVSLCTDFIAAGVAPAVQKNSAKKDESDTPPFDVETKNETKRSNAKTTSVTNYPVDKDFDKIWQEVLNALEKKLLMPVLTHLKLCKVSKSDNILFVYMEDDMTAMLIDKNSVKDEILAAFQQKFPETVSSVKMVQINEPVKNISSELEKALNAAKANGISVNIQ